MIKRVITLCNLLLLIVCMRPLLRAPMQEEAALPDRNPRRTQKVSSLATCMLLCCRLSHCRVSGHWATSVTSICICR